MFDGLNTCAIFGPLHCCGGKADGRWQMADGRWQDNVGRRAIGRFAVNSHSQRRRRYTAGLTLIELLTVFAILGMVVAMMLMGVQYAREVARRTSCVANLRQLGIAVANYEQSHQHIPPGLSRGGYSVHFRLLPYLERNDLYTQFDSSKAYDDPPNFLILKHGVSVFRCPSNANSVRDDLMDYTSYVASAGGGNPANQNGMFVHLKKSELLRNADITDGMSQTAAMTEAVAHARSAPGAVLRGKGVVLKTRTRYSIPSQLELLVQDCLGGSARRTNRTLGREWINGSVAVTRIVHVLPPNRSSCQNSTQINHGIYTPSSNHSGGVNVLFGDGAVRFVDNGISRPVWTALGTRNGNEASTSY
jgi:prepilin-type processing-associated H-X9-DG protein